MAYHIRLWEPEISPHKLPLFRALRARDDVASVSFHYDGELSAARRSLGWSPVVEPGEAVLPAGDGPAVEAAILSSPADTIHIFSGMHWVPSIVHGLKICARHGRRFGLLHEPRVLEGAKGKARLVHSWLTEHHLRKQADFVLGVGAHGRRWFRLTGFSDRQIFPFAYFLQEPADAAPENHEVARIGFVGRLERAKGFHLFLDATRMMRRDVEVHVVGRGSLAPQAEALFYDGALRGRFHGALAFDQVPDLMAKLDLLVLPSITTDDGWGAVVSEALMAGTAVVVSAHVGSSMCIVDPKLGQVVLDLTPRGVAAAVEQVLSRSVTDHAARPFRRNWARPRLGADAGAQYLIDIFEHVYSGAPRPPSFVN